MTARRLSPWAKPLPRCACGREACWFVGPPKRFDVVGYCTACPPDWALALRAAYAARVQPETRP